LNNFTDLTGKTFNRLTVIKRVENNKYGNTQWLCECNCENKTQKIITGNNLRTGRTKSCGCLMIEKAINTGKSKKKYNTYDLTGEYGIGYTFKDELFYFDLENYYKIKNYCWSKNKDGYITAKNNKKTILMHRLITNCPSDMQVDHVYHNRWDNRKEFLRIVTNSQNQMNASLMPNNTSGITGVSWNIKREKWVAYIMVNERQVQLGYFDDFNKAVEVRKDAELKYFGEYRYKEKIKNEK
jgi:hypothetical protein